MPAELIGEQVRPPATASEGSRVVYAQRSAGMPAEGMAQGMAVEW